GGLGELEAREAMVLHVEECRDGDAGAWQRDAERRQRSFDLARGPLFKAILYRTAHGDRLLLLAHHLIVDGVSWRIILDDLEQCYDDLCAGRAPRLTPQLDGYARWAAELDRIVRSGEWGAGRAFWTAQFAERGAAIVRDHAGADNTYARCASAEVTLSADATRGVVGDAHAAFNTSADDLLLTALGRAIAAVHGHHATWIALEGHGRDLLDGVDVSGAIGWLPNGYAFLWGVDGGDMRAQLRSVKEALRDSERHALAYHALRLRDAGSMVASEPPCPISFNYMGQIDRVSDRGVVALAGEDAASPIAATLMRDHDLDVGAAVTDGRLTLSITYNRDLHDTATAETLLAAFARELEEVVTFCRARRTAEKTPADFTACALPLTVYDELLAAHRWSPADVDDVCPLSSMQEGLLFQSLFDETSRAYFLQLNYRITGDFDVERFRRAWRAVARRHAGPGAAIRYRRADRASPVSR